MTNGPIVNNKRQIVIAVIVSALPILLLWLIDSMATSIQAKIPGSLYRFTLYYSLRQVFVIAGAILFIVHSILATAYCTGTMRSKWVMPSLKVIWLSALMCILTNYTSFGYLEETGVSYKSPITYYKTEKIAWSQMDRFAQLDVGSYWGRGSGRNYICIIKLQTKNEQASIEFNIPFTKDNAYKSLSIVLRILRHNQFHVATHFKDRAFVEMSNDKNMSEFLHDIRSLTEIR